MSGFFAGGNKSLSFGPIGSTHMKNVKMGGKIVSISSPQPVTKYGGTEIIPGAQKLVVTLSTWEGQMPEQAQDADDRGIRDYHVQFTPASTDSVAINRALKEAGITSGDLRIGDELYLEWVDHPLNEQNANARYKNAWYFPNAQAGAFGQAAPAQPQAPAPVPQFAPQQPQAPQQGGFMQQAAPAPVPQFAPQQPTAPPVQQGFPGQQHAQQAASQEWGTPPAGPPQADPGGFPQSQGFAPQQPAQAQPQGPVNPFAGQQAAAPDPFAPQANTGGFQGTPPF